jgi:DNA-binding transcriptional ArsR family regulator
MGASKIHQYSLKQRSFAKTAKAIGHPARVAIVQYLAEYGLGTNIDFMRVTNLADATVSQHVAELNDAGIIIGHFIHKQHHYHLTSRAEKAVADLNLLFATDGA